ncbi:MAG: sugar transferase [Candidatus Gracilibacteria bacterium]
MKRSEVAFSLLRIPTDFVMTVLGLMLGYYLRLQGDFIPGVKLIITRANLMPIDEYLNSSLIFGGLLVAVFAFFGLYKLKNTEGPLKELGGVAKFSIVWVLVMMAYFFVTHKVFFSRLVLIYGAIIAVILIAISRLILRRIERSLLNLGIGQRRVLLIGTNKISKRIANSLREDPHYRVIGYLADKGGNLQGVKLLGSIKNLKSVVKNCNIEEIILTTQNLEGYEDHQILNFCNLNHVEYRFVPDVLEMERSNFEINQIADYPLIHLKPTPLDGWGKITKRIIDLVLSGTSLLILSPAFAIIAIGIKIDSKGPVFFARLEDGSPAYRIGANGKKFKFYKFRTMKHNSHHMRAELKNLSHRKGPLMKIKNDPRVTRFGKFLRHTSLDELPNLWSVFKGDMSLIGPRPHLPEEVAEYEEHHKFLLAIKPGITGPGQISGRSDLDFEEEVRLDSYYIKHWSLITDLKILAKTIAVVFRGHAAD